ncbi:hypothetical protein [Streptomyces sp. NPDC051546]|uniref:hypothetical protein n=1 Tax=Streptomyces sp. NPDC051546 TaxID=3365655 RepID=UPI00378AB6AC
MAPVPEAKPVTRAEENAAAVLDLVLTGDELDSVETVAVRVADQMWSDINADPEDRYRLQPGPRLPKPPEEGRTGAGWWVWCDAGTDGGG